MSEDDLTYSSVATTGDKTKLTSIKNVAMTTPQWYEWDITGAVKSKKTNNNNTICLMLCDSVQLKKGDNNIIASFHSRENVSGNTPRLVVEEENVSELLLTEIKIDSNPLAAFQPTTFGYTVYLSPNIATVPVVSATQTDSQAGLQITQAENLTGTLSERTAEIKISKSGKELIYFVTFEQVPLNNNTSLSDLSVDGKTIEFFTSAERNYTYYLPYSHNTATIPNINFEANNPNQELILIPAANLTGTENERTAIVRIKSGDETTTEDYTVTFEILSELHLYLCIGQSNMSGCGYVRQDLGDLEPIDNVYLLTPKLKWEIAANPLNKYSSKRKDLSLQRIGPSYGFAINLNKKTNTPIGLIVNALGGSSMAHWTKGNAEGLYEAALLRAKEAQKWGNIKAILWHQGESN